MAGALRVFIICFFIFQLYLFVEAKFGKSAGKGRASSRSSHSYPSSSGLSGSRTSHHTSNGFSGSRISYPSSSGLSGSKSSYPSSNGLSGSKSRSSYPSSNGLSGLISSYPSSNGLTGSRPSYPSSNGLSGTGTSYPSSGHNFGLKPSYPVHTNAYPTQRTGHQIHSYPASNRPIATYPHPVNSYPRPNQYNSHSYPPSHGGLSGSGYTGYAGSHYHDSRYSKVYHPTTTFHHHHYHYNPPTYIHYGGYYSHPVYTGILPSYVYEYRSSESRYRNLLAGLALYNLGRSHHRKEYYYYTPRNDEICKFGVRYRSGMTEEMVIDCRMITSFIIAYEQEQRESAPFITQTTNTVKVVQNETVTNHSSISLNSTKQIISNPITTPVSNSSINLALNPVNLSSVRSELKITDNGVNNSVITNTDIPVIVSQVNLTAIPTTVLSELTSSATSTNISSESNTSSIPSESNSTSIFNSSSPEMPRSKRQTVTTNIVTTTTTQVSASDPRYNGPPIDVNPGMECYVTRSSSYSYSYMWKPVDCGLIQAYSVQSLRSFSNKLSLSSFVLLLMSVTLLF